jgi:sporulation protein YunB
MRKFGSYFVVSFVSFLFTFVFLILLYDYIVKKCLLNAYIVECENLCEETIYLEIEKYLDESDLQSSDIVSVVKSEDGKTSAYVTNDILLNQLKIDLINKLNSSIDNLDKEYISLRLLSITKNTFFISRGPSIKIRFNPVGNVSGELYKEIENVGINQIDYTIRADFTVNVESKTDFYNISIDIPIMYDLINVIIIDDIPMYYSD